MSVGPISGSGNTDLAVLQKQLQADQKQLQADQAAKASDQQIAIDQARVQLDSAAVTSAQTQSARPSGGGSSVDLYL